MDTKTTIINLIVLGKLNTKMKLNTKEKIFTLDEYNRWQGLYRFYRRDDRFITVEKIELLVRNVDTIVSCLKTNNCIDDNVVSLEEIYNYICEAMDGLEKLKETYEDDKTISSRLTLEIKSLDKIRSSIKIKEA